MAALMDILGINGRIPTDTPTAELLSSVDKGAYIQEKHVFWLDDVPVPMYLLIPKEAIKPHVMMAFHGHAPSVHHILGESPIYDENFGQHFAEDGYLVCAIEQRGFGERVTDQVKGNSCRHLAFDYMMHGKTLLGERVRDGIAALNYVLSRWNYDVSCVGHSGGATTALFLSALDARINHTIISSYFCEYKKSILGMPHCECNYVPNLLTVGDVGDIAAMIAPRDLLIVHGQADTIFPIDGVDAPYQVVKAAYPPQACSIIIHPGGHEFVYAISRDWLG